jgi:O-antigen/teichoic acid export membrane protein
LNDEQRTKELYYRAHKYLALLGVPIVFYVVAVSHRFVELWIGPNLTMLAFPLSVLLVVNYINLATGPGFLIFAGKGNLRPGIRSAMLGLILNVILSLGLIYKFGFAGAVIGTSVSLITASVYFISLFHGITEYSLFRVFRESYLKTICGSVVGLSLALTIHPVRRSSWHGLIETGLVFGAAYVVAILLSRFLDEYDWGKIESIMPIAKRMRRAGLVA